MDRVKEYIALTEIANGLKSELNKLKDRGQHYGIIAKLHRLFGSRVWNDVQQLKRELHQSGYWVGVRQYRDGECQWQVIHNRQRQVIKADAEELRSWMADMLRRYEKEISDHTDRTK